MNLTTTSLGKRASFESSGCEKLIIARATKESMIIDNTTADTTRKIDTISEIQRKR